MSKTIRPYTIKEEVWSSIIHGVGVALGIAALVILVVFSSIYGDAWAIVSTAIFGASMILLYTASTVYHAIPFPEVKKKLKKFDHIAIYYLIAGTYTPFLLVNLRGTTGWIIFGVVWGLAVVGTFLKLLSQGSGTKIWSIGLYLLMGWMILFASKSLVSELPSIGLVFLTLGGLFYTLGIFFYVWKSKKYTHAIWHFFVLVGTIMHFFAILYSCVLN
ncbi:MAG: hemolysin III family protein [Lactobacillaceae bacterium]|jgi:hemolysin III|nr:hemolysin III family protein [Lactobacillaceae bacterium]